ncbi:diguanylate cyclase (GGDEF)-like protein [Bacillus pakistanensis]|uniref:Diguanylate cyclase (GGDEF)-like protein n=1 Tax=Rossellomorea pakistanensis TaxID=992288 RepID=A0ABS2NBW8_9BACI|nr:GGDEF domain-containing protein [Bacillus pakistanensis]MBM7585300.1 diguanylate cyclase (GGDEF)-like protein [Bacillus pakistanensis]
MKYKGRWFCILFGFSSFFIFQLGGFYFIGEVYVQEFSLKCLLLIPFLLLTWFIGYQYDKVKFYAEQDFLTEVYNRRYVYTIFPKLKKRYAFIYFLVIDIDHFKYINDTYGHAYGDKALKVLTNVLKEKTGKEDIIARWGGDEFIILSPSVGNHKDVEQMVRNMFVAMEDQNKTSTENISISIGFSRYPDEGQQLEELLKLADENMYKHKG